MVKKEIKFSIAVISLI